MLWKGQRRPQRKTWSFKKFYIKWAILLSFLIDHHGRIGSLLIASIFPFPCTPQVCLGLNSEYENWWANTIDANGPLQNLSGYLAIIKVIVFSLSNLKRFRGKSTDMNNIIFLNFISSILKINLNRRYMGYGCLE